MYFVTYISIFILHLLLRVSAQSSIIDKCKEVVFTCDCGNPGYAFQAVFKQCHYWFPKEEACTKFQFCLECDSNSDKCVTCRPNRYGRYCRGTCNCKKGEKCDRDTGECSCAGNSCQTEVPTPVTVIEDKFCRRSNEMIHGKIEYIIPGTGSRTHDDTYPPKTIIRYSCEQFYELDGASQRLCNSDGQWSGIDPRCKPECGISADKVPSIIHGTKASLGEWPWQVAIAYVQNLFIFCGGSLISEKWIVTAAHCMKSANSTVPLSKDAIRLYFGKLYRGNSGDTVQERGAEEIIIHTKFRSTTLDSDIALIRVMPLILTNFVRPVCLTTRTISQRNLERDKVGLITGWGKDESGRYSDVLKVTNLTIVSLSTCKISNNDLHITDNMFCAGSPAGRLTTDSCSGDSGGPMVFLVSTGKGPRWHLEGVISWGVTEGCATANKYSGFTKISQFIEWIEIYLPL